MRKEFLAELSAYLLKHQSSPKWHPTQIQQLADGMFAVQDSMNEMDIYFDKSVWEPIHPGIWGDSLFPSTFAEIGILQGIGQAPAVRICGPDALACAQRQLKPESGDVKWDMGEISEVTEANLTALAA